MNAPNATLKGLDVRAEIEKLAPQSPQDKAFYDVASEILQHRRTTWLANMRVHHVLEPGSFMKPASCMFQPGGDIVLPPPHVSDDVDAEEAERVAVRGVVTTMIQTEKYGTPLASALRVLSAEFRNERMMRAEEKAARLPAIMTVPLILFILPTLFIVILGPAACSINDSFING